MAWKAFFSILITLLFLIIIYSIIKTENFIFLAYLLFAFLVGYLLYQLAKLHKEPTKPNAHSS